MPISLRDMLFSLYCTIHEHILHADWETLTQEDTQAVTRAFAQRCCAGAIQGQVLLSQLRDRKVAERN
ncbi:hypothetical protein B0H13DRAFT_1648718 [Mycena leptocephala]|nr:hypothetical protein B0H13DRAFT_1648718 [Mycena leptocephala]